MFKVGDKVICVDSRETDLSIGSIYTVTRIGYEHLIVLAEFPHLGLFEERFKIYDRKEKLEKILR